jgi:LuxR family maltose regulon positive regulatory protein
VNTAVLDANAETLYKRPRVTKLLEDAARRPVTVVTASAGCGKTCAVYSFLRDLPDGVISWVQLSERDNDTAHFWENFARSLGVRNRELASALLREGFPENAAQFERTLRVPDRFVKPAQSYAIVFDDLHLIRNREVLSFIERSVHTPYPTVKTILISRSDVPVSLIDMESKGQVSRISEEQLRFDEHEVHSLFMQRGIALQPQALHDIHRGAGGWAFALQFALTCLEREPHDVQKAISAMEKGVSMLIESQAFAPLSPRARKLLIKLSLVDQPSSTVVQQLAGDDELIAEVSKSGLFLNYDAYSDTYRIHRLYLDFLTKKQCLLTESDCRETYETAAKWCFDNNLLLDAAAYYEKIADYYNLNVIIYFFPITMTRTAAEFFSKLIVRLSGGKPESPNYFFELLLHAYKSNLLRVLKRYKDARASANATIIQFENGGPVPFRNVMLYSAYNNLGFITMDTCLFDKQYDFYRYFLKAEEYFDLEPIGAQGAVTVGPVNSYVCMIGTPAAKGEFETYIDAVKRSVPHISKTVKGMYVGLDDLACCEMHFYQGNFTRAAFYANRAMASARGSDQFEIEARALFFLARIGVAQGDYSIISAVYDRAKAMVDIEEFLNRRALLGMLSGWFYSKIENFDKVPLWIKSGVQENGLSDNLFALETFVKCHYCFCTNQYSMVLSLIHNLRLQTDGLFLLGEIELTLLEAVSRYKLRNFPDAITALTKAYNLAEPMDITTPFVELGKSAQALLRAAADDPRCEIPREWLNGMSRACSAYAKRRSLVVSRFRTKHGIDGNVALSTRDLNMLKDLYHGLSRTQIASRHYISVNTVKTALQTIYAKLGAENNVDAIRLATEMGLLDKI